MSHFCVNNVDEIIFRSTKESLCKEFSEVMRQELEMSMVGELNYFLEVQIKQGSESTFISQSKYAKELLKRFGLEGAKSYSTPISTSIKLDKDECDEKVSEKFYRGMIGRLLYLTAGRPDIILLVGTCTRFQSNRKISHLTDVKRIFRYLKCTIELGLWYLKNIKFQLIGYSDTDFVGCLTERKIFVAKLI